MKRRISKEEALRYGYKGKRDIISLLEFLYKRTVISINCQDREKPEGWSIDIYEWLWDKNVIRKDLVDALWDGVKFYLKKEGKVPCHKKP